MGFKLSGTGGSLKFNKSQNYVEGMGLKVKVPPPTVPGAPTGLSAVDSWNNGYGASQVDLSWSAPSSDGGSPITSYNIYLDGYGLFDTVTMPGSLSYTMPQYTPTLPYSFTVTAVNAVGESAQSSAATGVGFLEAPPEPTITAASWIDLVDPGKAEVTFDVDPAHPVASITLYNASDDSLVYSDPSFGDNTSSVGLGNSFQLSGMSEGSPTSLYLVLSNSAGLSPTGSFTLIARPATPSNFAYTWAGTLNDDITFSWDAVPGADYYQLYDTVSFNNSTVYGTSHVFPSPLEPETEYTFTLWTVVGGSVSLQTSSIITTGAT